MTNENAEKNAKKIVCNKCYFSCSKESEWYRHISTLKHKIRTNTNEKTPKTPKNANLFSCYCGKLYKHASSLWNHKQKCNTETTAKINTIPDNDIIRLILNQNIELTKKNDEAQSTLIKELQKEKNNTIHNKTFNLNIFLNETCKDAMNLSEFIDSIQIGITDVDKIGDIGFVNSISNIILKELKSIEISKRPLHCSDVKRETIYVRDEDKWGKEEIDKEKIRNMIACLSEKNLQMLKEWKRANPSFYDSSSYASDKYNKIILKSLDNTNENLEKVIKTIARQIKI